MKKLFKDKKTTAAIVLLLLFNLIVIGVAMQPTLQDEQISIPQSELLMDRGGGNYEKGFYVDNGYEGEDRIVTPTTWLRRGYYAVTVDFDTNNGTLKKGKDGYGNWLVVAADTQWKPGYNAALVESDRIEVFNGQNTATFVVRVKQSGEYRVMSCLGDVSEGLYTLVHDVSLEYLQKRTFIFYVVHYGIRLLLLDLFLLAFLLRRERTVSFLREHAISIAGITVITFLAYYPYFEWNIFFGGDIWYHLNRIRYLADGMATGYFPVRIHPGWSSSFGYAAGVYYGDLLLMPSAILLLLGYTMNAAYKFYILMTSFITATSSYYAAKKISGDRITAVICSALYTLAIHRIMLVTPFHMVGQFGAHAVTPLVAVGLYGIYARRKDAPYIILLAIGFTGVLTHVVTTLMLLFVVPFLALLLWKRTFQKDTFFDLLKGIGLTILLNLFFLVPFFDYMFNQEIIGSIVTEKPWHWARDVFNVLVRDGNEPTDGVTIGIVTILIVAASIGMLLAGKIKSGTKEYVALLITIGFFSWLSTSTFPWYWLQWNHPLIERIMLEIQFPQRFFGVVSPLTLVLLAWTLCAMKETVSEHAGMIFGTLLCAMCLMQMMDYYKDLNTYGHRIEIYDERAKMPVMPGAEFVIPGSLESGAQRYQEVTAEEDAPVFLSDYSKNGTTVLVTAENHSEDAQEIYFPLWAYRGYVARAGATKLTVRESEDHRVQVTLPAGFAGQIRVYYHEPWYWRIAELVSLLTALLLIFRRIYPAKDQRVTGIIAQFGAGTSSRNSIAHSR